MKNREKLFIYGTLKNLVVQKSVFGRTNAGLLDKLKGCKKSKIKINGQTYPLIVHNNKNSKIQGLVIEVTDAALKKIDDYETKAYKRVKRILESGQSTWVYIKR